ncbi:DEAD box helicase [Plasmodium coatneyi]|uniref:ATP-dependent RNA helicase n=1 Tax=Plasmodium coatneyi TaxID=208452 RepID=A0A1B1DTS7_9APIC|nr:DEAD box helicase [Plasmodium coatneyi]ANQ06188.1 DEAD box helicase [Plasmodium coatneyi]
MGKFGRARKELSKKGTKKAKIKGKNKRKNNKGEKKGTKKNPKRMPKKGINKPTEETFTKDERKDTSVGRDVVGDATCSSPPGGDLFDGLFADLKGVLSESLLQTLEKNRFIKTTSIQKRSIPIMLSDNDVFLKSMTGSGKTLCYALPSVQKVLNLQKEKIRVTRDMGTFILVLSPTRELAVQINSLFFTLTKPYPYIVVSCLTGGEKKKSEKNRLKKGVSILTCTPGRLLDHLEHTKALKLVHLQCVILDEADKVIFLGTQDKVRLIYDTIKRLRRAEVANTAGSSTRSDNPPEGKNFQMVFISATLNHAVKSLANYCLTNRTVWVEGKDDGARGGKLLPPRPPDIALNNGNEEVGTTNIKDVTSTLGEEQWEYELPEQLKQFCIVADFRKKFLCLVHMLLSCMKKKQKPVVFLSNCHSVEYMRALLKSLYWPTDLKKENMEAHKKLNEGVSSVLLKEDEKLLRKHLEKTLQREELESGRKSKKRKERITLPFKNINVDDLQGGDSCDDGNTPVGADGSILYNVNTDRHKRKYLFGDTQIYILHGNLSKEDRLGNFSDFAYGKNNKSILICTQIVSRGVNFDELDVVIQYDPPQVFEEYVHKVGRTARLHKEGSSYLFLLPTEVEFLNVLREKKIHVKTIQGEELIGKFRREDVPPSFSSIGGNILSFIYNHFKVTVKSDEALMEKATSAFLASVTAYYSVSKSLRHIFCAKNLHLGHLAYAFLLDESPKEIAKLNKQQRYLKVKRQTTLSKRERRLLRAG